MNRREKLLQMLQEDPNDAFLLYGLAMEDQSAEDWESALATFDRVLTVDPESVAAYFQKGQILARLDRSEDARSALKAGIHVGQRLGDAHAVGEMTEFLQNL